MRLLTHSRLLRWAEIFLFTYCVILTIAPSVRERAFEVDYRWSHWLAFAVWLIVVEFASAVLAVQMPEADPYLFPAAALLSGWGLLSIWRMDEVFGLRQLVWLVVSLAVFLIGLRLPSDLQFLRRYKYVLLSGGLVLTALTLLLGTNPGGYGPRLWLGCCGVYFQPSEPLKLLLVIYMAAYLADKLPVRLRVFPLVLPTVLVTGLALLLLIVQRDLGTASIFILIFTVILFIATGYRRVLISTFLALALAGLVGYSFISVIHIRVDAWLDPWFDPSGRSYQIIQSLLAVANGGAIGRGPGLGSPTLVPVAISDFIFAAIAEETGLAGVIGLLGILGLILTRGVIASLRAPDQFRRLLAAGATAYIGIQSLLIIGGNLRIVPLTGVTLPFVSYGGSSLLTSFIALLLLLQIGSVPEHEPAHLSSDRPYLVLTGILGLGLLAAAFASSWWSVVRAPDLLARTDNPRRSIADRYVRRGALLDQQDTAINITIGQSGSYARNYLYPDLGPIVGYTHPIYGQAGLESSLDDYLRGLQGNPSSLIWLDHLLYGTPPPGLDIRLSLQLQKQATADQMFGTHPGAALLMNARSGEVLVMASHPTFDATNLDETGASLTTDPHAPLLNRAAQGSYRTGTATTPFLKMLPAGAEPTRAQRLDLFNGLGFFSTPQVRLPVAAGLKPVNLEDLQVSPLQMVIAASALSNHGTLPAPRIALAVNTLQQGWVILPALGRSRQQVEAAAADSAARAFIAGRQPFWEYTGQATQNDSIITWYLGGTLPDWQGTPLAVVITLEEDNTYLARKIGQSLLLSSLGDAAMRMSP
jgi:cell division protein FtsW (lipid II flippase)